MGMGMIHYAVAFLFVAIVAGILGFVILAGAAAPIARVLFLVFLAMFAAALIVGKRGRGLE
jgi:uncharacterized membrane protein YtjA (UPF0391 family)